MRIQKSKKLFQVELEFKNGLTRRVAVKAADRLTAEKRALKFNPSAVGVKRNGT